MKRLVAIAIFCAMLVLLRSAPVGGGDDAAEVKEALQELNLYVGGWKGSGTSERNKTEIWQEMASWGWRFKGKDAWLTMDIKNGKIFKSAELRFLPSKSRYQLTMVDKSDKKLVFEGALKKNRLILERNDPATKETQQLVMNTAADGDRFIYTYNVKPENRTLFNKELQVAMTREGVTFAAAGGKKAECIVTGGLGTMAVSFRGVTYYVCCTGCRDAFNENPEKYIKEYAAKKKGGK